MSPRRRYLVPAAALALSGLVAAGLGLREWPVDGDRASAFAGRGLGPYGLDLTARGPARLTLLPLPSLTLDRVSLAAGPGGPALAEGGRLTVEIDPLALLGGRAAVGGVQLDGARLSPDAAAWAGPLARSFEMLRAAAPGRPNRIALTAARVGDGEQARDIDLDLAWPRWGASAEARAALTWRGVPTRIALAHLRPDDLAAGRPSPFTAGVTWPGGDLAADGTAFLAGGEPRLVGRARIETRSLPRTLAWLGWTAPLAPLAGSFALDGDFEATQAPGAVTVSWPKLRVGLGGDSLEGAGAVTLGSGDAPRPSVQATLAADTLNLAPLLGALVRLFEVEAPPLSLGPPTGGDLDLRLSAAAVRAGPVAVEDLAASVLVRGAAVEVAVNRARLRDGTVKGRVALAPGADPGETEMRAQGSFDRVDLGGLLNATGEPRWVLGPMQGQFAVDGSGRDGAGLLAHLGGRLALSVDGGALVGLDLADVVHRNGGVAPGPLARRNGRTAFERAAVSLRFADGVGEITEAGLRGPGVGATLRGRVSLPDLRLDLQGDLALRSPVDPSRGVGFEVSGPLLGPPDALVARAAPNGGNRGEAAEPTGGPTAAALPGPLTSHADPDLPGGARAYAP